ncbi:hypothetical protein HN51_004489 [Arachis hypogaea]|nr:uncharacterized protein DS421_4g117080 [Arachis hypogaea]
MASGAPFPSSFTSFVTLFFFSLLLAFHFSMAIPIKHTFFTPLTSSKRNTLNTMVVASPSPSREATKKNNNVLDRRASRPPSFQWRNKIFNVSQHEVPSGPNPISNR